MGVRVDLNVERQRLLDLGRSPAGPIYRHMLKVGVKITARATANLSGRMVGVRTGVLRQAQAHPPDLRVGGTKITGTVVNNARYARWVHEGTAPHTIRPNGRVLAWADPTAARGVRFARSVQHPGTKARPFLREAAEHVIRADL